MKSKLKDLAITYIPKGIALYLLSAFIIGLSAIIQVYGKNSAEFKIDVYTFFMLTNALFVIISVILSILFSILWLAFDLPDILKERL